MNRKSIPKDALTVAPECMEKFYHSVRPRGRGLAHKTIISFLPRLKSVANIVIFKQKQYE